MISIMSSLMSVACVSLVVPRILCPSCKQEEPPENILVLSHISSIILLLFYFTYLYFRLYSHAHIFQSDNDTEENENRELSPWAAGIVLILATVGISQCADYFVDSIDGIVETFNISRTFIGLIIVPIVGNVGQLVITVKAAMDDKLGFAIGVMVESTLQIAILIIPFMVIMGRIIGVEMTLLFDAFETTVLFLAVIVQNCLVQDGRTNYFEGVMLIAT